MFLDESEVGTHRFTLRQDGEARERWQDGCLASLVSRTEDNGERYAVDWRGREGCAMSFAYWDPRILRQSRLLNAQTGEFEPVRATPLGGGRWQLTAPGIEIELGYAGGEWVSLEALKNGRRLRYVLEARR